jgi:pimeloyl-ACP methyl ester carboxylesterase
MSRRASAGQIEPMELITTKPTTERSSALSLPEPAWLDRSLYPFKSRFFSTDEGRLHYVDEGQGRPVLFVHGTPSWSFEWRHAIASLRGEARAIAIDHLGFGLSDKPLVAAYRPEDHARRLLGFVRALDLQNVTLVVHDFGGPIALPVIFEEPGRVRALVVVNSWAWAHGDDPRIRKLSRLVASPFGKFLYLWLNASPRWLVPQSIVQRASFTREVHAHYLGPFSARAARIAPWVLGCELAGSDAFYASLWERRDELRRLQSALVWGERDPAFGLRYLERWQAAMPDARVHRLPNVGHFPQEEAPQQLLAALRDTLAAGL